MDENVAREARACIQKVLSSVSPDEAEAVLQALSEYIEQSKFEYGEGENAAELSLYGERIAMYKTAEVILKRIDTAVGEGLKAL